MPPCNVHFIKLKSNRIEYIIINGVKYYNINYRRITLSS